MAFNPLFKLSESHLPAPVILFATFGGLRGAVSLILAQMLVSQQDEQQKSRDMLQTAQVSLGIMHSQRVDLQIMLQTAQVTCCSIHS